MAEYEPGKMDIQDQEKGYNAFWGWAVRASIIIFVILLLMYFLLL